MIKLFALCISLLVAIACGGNEEDVPQPPTPENKHQIVEAIDRKPFYKANPESRAPSAEVCSDELPLAFLGWEAERQSFVLNFPEGERRRVILEYTMGSEGRGPADYDHTTMLFVRNKATDEWLEIARAFTPFGLLFDSSWKKRFYLDVTEFSSLLQGDSEFFIHYGGFDSPTAERLHSVTLRFLLYDGEAERELLAIEKLYDSFATSNSGYRGWAYGVAGHDIEAEERLGVRSVTLPEGAGDIELRMSITGHGHDMGTFPDIAGYEPQNMAEFVENSYSFIIDGYEQESVGRIFYSNADNYLQQGTYMYDRANWAPGNPANVQYWRITPSQDIEGGMTIDIELPEFVSSFDAPNAEGVAQYIVEADLFIYKR